MAIIRRGDFLFTQKGNKAVHKIIGAATFAETVHVAVAISQTHAIEMHLGGLRTRRIERYKAYRILRPPYRLWPAMSAAINRAESSYLWRNYGYLHGIRQGLKRIFGFWLPKSRNARANCSMLAADVANFAGETEIQTDESRYDPKRLLDHLIMADWLELEEVQP